MRVPATLAGRRSSSAYAARVVADAFDGSSEIPTLDASRWRETYRSPFAALTQLSADPSSSLRIAERGLRSAHQHMVYAHRAGDVSLGQWRTEAFDMKDVAEVVVAGRGRRIRRVEVPYRGELLHGADLDHQLSAWVAAGVFEPGFAQRVRAAVANPDWLCLPDHEVVLVGAAAAMAPLHTLMGWGANVVAVDMPLVPVQDRLRAVASAGSGSVTLPVLGQRHPVSGASIATDTAELRTWLAARWSRAAATPVLGNYAYADGAAHVEATVATDMLALDLVDLRPDGALAFLNTPTDSFLVPSDAVRESQSRWAQLPLSGRAHGAIAAVSGRRAFAPAYRTTLQDHRDGEWGLIDTTVSVQGPNYVLAKRLQRWRAVMAAQRGSTVSTTVAPASWTTSVTKNRTLAAVYSAAHRFGVEIFEPETIAPLLAAKLVADLHLPTNTCHPEALFSDTAAHGGLWRQPFDPASALWAAGLIGAFNRRR